MYEVLPTEPLHDVKENISNIIIEISAHLSDDAKKLCEETLSLVSGTKDQLHGSDYWDLYCACKTIERWTLFKM